jgi:hypothetical protein
MKRFYTATNLRLSKGDHQLSHSSFSLRGMRADSQDYVKFVCFSFLVLSLGHLTVEGRRHVASHRLHKVPTTISCTWAASTHVC